MNRKSLIFTLSALVAFAAVLVVAVCVLYRSKDQAPEALPEYGLINSIPTNALSVCFLNQSRNVQQPIFMQFDVLEDLSESLENGQLGTIADLPMAISLHYAGEVSPLFVFDVGSNMPVASSEANALARIFHKNEFLTSYVDCSTLTSVQPLAGKSLLICAETDALITSSINNIRQSLSLMESPSFVSAMKLAGGDDALFVSYVQSRPLFTTLFSRQYFRNKFGDKYSMKYSEMANFFVSVADWTVLSLDDAGQDDVSISSRHVYRDDSSDFLGVLNGAAPAVSSVSQMLPSYTTFALTLPTSDRQKYVEGYRSYLDSRQMLTSYNRRLDALNSEIGLSPDSFMTRLGISEVASACFTSSSSFKRVNLVKISDQDEILLQGTGLESFPETPQTLDYPFPTYISSLFGPYFQLEDESCFTCIDGWLITGSKDAVDEYVSGMALEYTLEDLMADSGQNDLLAKRICSAVVYVNAAENDAVLADVLTEDMLEIYKGLAADAEYSPSVISVYRKNNQLYTDLDLYHLSKQRSRVSRFERDTTVVIPSGPFEVMNSGTGRKNLFYQNENKAICLKETDGTGIWGVPFSHSICGTAHNVDFYANGNLQIVFGASSSIYMLDRLGRHVTGFPLDLGKEILLGPDVYDFNGDKSYILMVLHKDKNIEMYDLKGEKPDFWKGITHTNTIKALPERLEMGDKTFWVVRTSLQTLIYPFEGGEPLTTLEGDEQILPTSDVKVKNDSIVEVESYDGLTRTIILK